MTDVKITFNPLVFPDSTEPAGFLRKDLACQALWYYYILCEQQKSNVGSGPESQIIVVEAGRDSDVHWMDKHYAGTLTSLANIYSVEPQAMLNFWPLVIREAQRLELPKPDGEYMYPKRWLV